MKMRSDTTPNSRAWALAIALVPGVLGQRDSLWDEGAREIIFGLLLHAQKARTRMTNQQVAQGAAKLLAGDYYQILAIVSQEAPAGAVFLAGGPDSKAAASFLASVGAALSPRAIAAL